MSLKQYFEFAVILALLGAITVVSGWCVVLLLELYKWELVGPVVIVLIILSAWLLIWYHWHSRLWQA